MSRFFSITFAALLILTLSVPTVSKATTFLVRSERQKILEAKRICAVKVMKVEFIPQNVISKTAMTAAWVNPLVCFKDGVKKPFRVVYPGGETEKAVESGKSVRMKVSVPGTPDLQTDETYVLYLWRGHDGEDFTVQGWTEGVTPIRYDRKANDYVLARPLPTYQEATADKKTSSQIAQQSTKMQSMSLKRFGQHVEKVLRRGK